MTRLSGYRWWSIATLALLAAGVWGYRTTAESWRQATPLAEFQAEQQRWQPLEKTVSLSFSEPVTLAEWMAEFTRQTGVPVEIMNEQRALNEYLNKVQVDADFGPESLITANLPPLPARDALELFGQLHDIDWSFRGGSVGLNCGEGDASREVRTHPLPAELRLLPRYKLYDAITNGWQPDSWWDVGGPWQAEPTRDTITTRMSPAEHEQFEMILSRLAEAWRQADRVSFTTPANDRGWEPTWLSGDSAQFQALQRALEKPVTLAGTDCHWQPLVAEIAEQVDFPIVVTPRAAEKLSLDARRFTFELQEVPLKLVLRELKLAPDFSLSPAAQGRVLVLRASDFDEFRDWQTLAAYPIGDLLGPDDPERDADDLIELITGTGSTDTWSNVGGPGTIQSLLRGRLLLIAQTLDQHERIQELLTGIRMVRSGAQREYAGWLDPRPQDSPELTARLETPLGFEYRGEKRPQAIRDLLHRGGVQVAGLEDTSLLQAQVRFWCYLPERPLRDNLTSVIDAWDVEPGYLDHVLLSTATPPAQVDLTERMSLYIFDLRPWLRSRPSMPGLDGLITSAIDPDSWGDVGGPRSARVYRDLLILHCSPQVAHRVRQFLAALADHLAPGPRQWRGVPLAGEVLNRPLSLEFEPASARERFLRESRQEIAQLLQKRVTVHIGGQNLGNAIIDLARDHQLPVLIASRWVDLEERMVTLTAEDLPLGEVLQRLVSDPSQHAWRIESGCLVLRYVNRQEYAEYQPYLYNVDDLILPRGKLRPKQLVRTLLTTISDNDLEDEIGWYYPYLDMDFGNFLSPTFEVDNVTGREMFEQLLRDLRSGKLRPLPAQKGDSDYSPFPAYPYPFRPFVTTGPPLVGQLPGEVRSTKY